MPLHDWMRVDAGIFHDFHTVWIGNLRTRLNSGLLPADYYALAEQVAGGLGPDVRTLREPEDSDDAPAEGGGLAVATAPPRVAWTGRAEEEIYTRKQRQLVIRHASHHRVVAIVEIVSPGNKGSQHAFDSLLAKSLAALDQGIHLLLVDLLPPSRRDPLGIHSALWERLTGEVYHPPEGKDRTLAVYSGGTVKTAYVEPIRVGQALSEMPLFLSEERYVNVPLEETYQASYVGLPRIYRDLLEA
ncbi:MAG TPA: DUF4058 family protein [Gemmataceae bacterium]|jgi:hypothetical protein|nr:DUF4058 family protein [Gemmataceae bacterium]